MSDELVIYGAAYGKGNVTGKVRSLRKDQKLSVKASNDVFGDLWPYHYKTLVVVYSYGSGTVQTKIVHERETLEISPPLNSVTLKKDHLSLSLKSIVNTSRKPQSLTLKILGAAYGMKDVTSKAQSLVTSNGEFDQAASNDVWGDSWHGYAKTLVVVYECNKHYLVDIAVESQRMHFIASPPLTILGAAYGLKSVTEKVEEIVHHRSFQATANDETFGDGWPGVGKTLVIVYQYGEEQPSVALSKEKNELAFLYSKKDEFLGSPNPKILTILGAAYGAGDVTEKVRSLVKDGSTLNVKASNDVFGDTWEGEPKSLVVVYRYGRGASQMQIVAEHASMSVSIPKIKPNVVLMDTSNLLEDGDDFALSALNGKFISLDSSNKLVATQNKVEESCTFTVKKCLPNSRLTLQINNGKYVYVGCGDYLYASEDADDAELFTISISTSGSLYFSTKAGMYIRLDYDNANGLRADSVDHLPAYTSFDISFQQTVPQLIQQVLECGVKLTDCEKAMASFTWSLVGGFFLAIGLGPFLATGEAKPDLLRVVILHGLIKSSPTAWAAIVELLDAIIKAGLTNTLALAGRGISLMIILQKEGLLWPILKWLLKSGAWWAITKAIAKILQVIFIPETEAAELLASFSVWSAQLVQSGLAVGQACN